MVINSREFNLSSEYLELEYGVTAIFQFLFPYKIDFSTKYCNPIRNDKYAGCKFFVSSNVLIFRDWSKNINYNWIKFGKEYKQMNYGELLLYVYRGLNNQSYVKPKTVDLSSYRKTIEWIDIKSKEFSDEELLDFKFFDFQCSRELLKEAGVYSVSSLYYNNECVRERLNGVYAFLNYSHTMKAQYQIYFPKKDKIDRYRSCTTDLIPQWNNIDWNCDYIIITKSNMDALIQKHILGLNAIATLNEAIILPKAVIDRLRMFKIILLMDNDQAGRQCVIKYLNAYPEIDFGVIFVPFKYGKDTKDVVMNNKIEDVKQIINKKIK